MNEVSYGARGSQSGVCPRCQRGSDTHTISRCDIAEASVKGVEALISAARAYAGTHGESGVEDRMVGALVAKTTTGKDIKLVAVSGAASPAVSVHGWTMADVAVPNNRSNWMDIYGRTFDLPASRPIGNACAAIKLLMKLGDIRRSSGKTYDYNYIHLYEEAVRAADGTQTDRRGRPKKGKSTKLKKWKGQGVAYTYAAHSCDACQARVPLLLCSGVERD